MNRYLYANEDPVTLLDPTGRSWLEEIGVLSLGSKAQNLASAGFLKGLSYAANLSSHFSSGALKNIWSGLSQTASVYAKLAAAAAAVPRVDINPTGVVGVGATMSCWFALTVIGAFPGGDPGTELTNLPIQFPCVGFDWIPPIPPFS